VGAKATLALLALALLLHHCRVVAAATATGANRCSAATGRGRTAHPQAELVEDRLGDTRSAELADLGLGDVHTARVASDDVDDDIRRQTCKLQVHDLALVDGEGRGRRQRNERRHGPGRRATDHLGLKG